MPVFYYAIIRVKIPKLAIAISAEIEWGAEAWHRGKRRFPEFIAGPPVDRQRTDLSRRQGQIEAGVEVQCAKSGVSAKYSAIGGIGGRQKETSIRILWKITRVVADGTACTGFEDLLTELPVIGVFGHMGTDLPKNSLIVIQYRAGKKMVSQSPEGSQLEDKITSVVAGGIGIGGLYGSCISYAKIDVF